MKKLITTAILLLAVSSWAADKTIYIDSTWTGTESGTEAEPYNSFSDITAGDWTALNASAVAGDAAEVNLQGTFTEALTWTIGASGVSGNPIVINKYGDGAIFNGGDTLDTNIDINGYSYIDIKNCDFTKSTARGIYIRSNVGRKPEYINIEGCDFYDLNIPIHTYGNTEALAPDNIVIRNCTGVDNTSAFMASKWVDGVDYYDCSATDSAIHGFSSQAHMLDGSAIVGGWTLLSGTIYYRTTDSNTIYKVVRHNDQFDELQESASAYDSITSGEYKVYDGDLYINVGADPATDEFRIAVTVCQNINYYDCVADGITTTGDEGHGFCFDDFSTGSFNRCIAKNCDNDGFVFHESDESSMVSCLSYNNGRNGVWLNAATNGISIYHLTAFGNGANGINILGDAKDYVFQNNLIQGSGGYGLYISYVGDQTGTHDYNYFYGSTSGEYWNATQSANEVIDSNPILTTNGRISKLSPCVDAGSWITGINEEGQADINGKYVHRKPNIGADQWAGTPRDRSTLRIGR